MKNDYELTVHVKKTLGDEVFAKTYKIALRDELVWGKNPKEHNLTSHIEGLITQLKLNSIQLQKLPVKKFEIYAVNFSSSIGSEITAIRPALVITPNNLRGEDVTVIPLTSAAKEKVIDPYDLLLLKDADNKLYQNSYLRLRQIRAVSKNRLQKQLGEIKNKEIRQQINDAVTRMLANDD